MLWKEKEEKRGKSERKELSVKNRERIKWEYKVKEIRAQEQEQKEN